MNYILAFLFGLMTFSIAQETVLPCGRSCQAAVQRMALDRPNHLAQVIFDVLPLGMETDCVHERKQK